MYPSQHAAPDHKALEKLKMSATAQSLRVGLKKGTLRKDRRSLVCVARLCMSCRVSSGTAPRRQDSAVQEEGGACSFPLSRATRVAHMGPSAELEQARAPCS